MMRNRKIRITQSVLKSILLDGAYHQAKVRVLEADNARLRAFILHMHACPNCERESVIVAGFCMKCNVCYLDAPRDENKEGDA